jgi:UDP-N-acetylglucosamine acyltransferase
MIGGMSRIVQDVAPYMMAEGSPAAIRGTNAIGLKRRGMPPGARKAVKEAYKILFRSGLNLKSAMERIAEIEDETGEIKKLVDFIGSTKRGLTGF